MLGTWFRNRMKAGVVKEGRVAMTRLINHMEGIEDDRDIGPLVAVATVIRINLENMDYLPRGLFDIERIAELDPKGKAQLKLSALMAQFQRRKQESDAVGASILLHTLRALEYPELRVLGRDMWRELARGFDHVEDVFKLVEDAKKQPLDPRVRAEVRVIPNGLRGDAEAEPADSPPAS